MWGHTDPAFLLFNFQGSPRSPFDRKSREYGGVAQLGEHLPCKQGVKGSNPFISTTWRMSRDGTREEPNNRIRAHSSAG